VFCLETKIYFKCVNSRRRQFFTFI